MKKLLLLALISTAACQLKAQFLLNPKDNSGLSPNYLKLDTSLKVGIVKTPLWKNLVAPQMNSIPFNDIKGVQVDHHPVFYSRMPIAVLPNTDRMPIAGRKFAETDPMPIKHINTTLLNDRVKGVSLNMPDMGK